MIRNVPLPEIHSEEKPALHKHICPPTFGGGPLDPQKATVNIQRNLLVNIDVEFPNGEKLDMWTLEDPEDSENGKVFPAKLIRTTEGDTVHARVGAKTNTHTIHWHGIEPTPINDGVGKHSFEISGNFTYQFTTRQPGTFFYHCHKNTTLHFERGLYGLFIVDPKKPDIPEARGIAGPPYKTGGPGFISALNPPHNVRKYDIEALWVFDDIDTRWIPLGHDAAMQKCDPDNPTAKENFTQDGILNDFRPDVFVLTGKLRKKNDPTPFNEMAVNAKVGQTILIRHLNAGYTKQVYRLGLPAEIVAMDGYALGVGKHNQYSHPVKLAANQPFMDTAARRQDILVQATTRGKFPVTVKFFHWINGKELYTATTYINVEA